MIGRTISNYRILEKIGEGGMANMHLVLETLLGRKRALEFLPPFREQHQVARKHFLK